MSSIFKDSRPSDSRSDIRVLGVKSETIRIAGSQYDTQERYRSHMAPHDINSCHGTRKDGGSCGAYPMKGKATCFFHKAQS